MKNKFFIMAVSVLFFAATVICSGQSVSDNSMQDSAGDSSQDSAGASSEQSSQESAGASSEQSSQESTGASSEQSSQESTGASSEQSSQESSGASSRQSSQESSAGSSEQSSQESYASSQDSSSVTSTVNSFDYTTGSSGSDIPDDLKLVILGAVVGIGITAGAFTIVVAVKNAKEEEILGFQDQLYYGEGKEYDEVLVFFDLDERELGRANDELVEAGYLIETDQDAADYLAALMLRLAERSDKIKGILFAG